MAGTPVTCVRIGEMSEEMGHLERNAPSGKGWTLGGQSPIGVGKVWFRRHWGLREVHPGVRQGQFLEEPDSWWAVPGGVMHGHQSGVLRQVFQSQSLPLLLKPGIHTGG